MKFGPLAVPEHTEMTNAHDACELFSTITSAMAYSAISSTSLTVFDKNSTCDTQLTNDLHLCDFTDFEEQITGMDRKPW